MKVDITLIERGKSKAGGYTRAQLAILGEEWPPKVGWKQRAIGREISREQARLFLKETEGGSAATRPTRPSEATEATAPASRDVVRRHLEAARQRLGLQAKPMAAPPAVEPKQDLRAQMPQCAQWLDDTRDAFSRQSVEQGMRREGYYMREGGRELGVKVPDGFVVSGRGLFPLHSDAEIEAMDKKGRSK